MASLRIPLAHFDAVERGQPKARSQGQQQWFRFKGIKRRLASFCALKCTATFKTSFVEWPFICERGDFATRLGDL